MSASPPDDERVDSNGATARNVAITAAVAFALHAVALFRVDILNSDEATIGTIARMMRNGAGLYRDAVDRKPPGAFVLYWLIEPAFGSWTIVAARWLALCLTIAAAWVIAIEARRRWSNTSPLMVAVVFIVAFSLLPAEDSRAVGFELLGTLPAISAFVLGARGRTVLAGVALGVAGLFKQTLLFGAFALAVQCLTLGIPWPRRLLRLAVAGAATIATVAAGLAPFGLSDALKWFSGSGDNYLGGTTISAVLSVAAGQIGAVIVLTSGLVVLAVSSWWRRRPPVDVVVWLVAGVVAVSIGFRFILHYFIQILPPLVLLAAPALIGRAAFQSRRTQLAGAALVGAATYSLVTVMFPTAFHDLPNVDPVVAAVRERTEPGDKIFVWGQAPEIYWLSERDPATRFPHLQFITGITPKRPGVAAYLQAQPGADEILVDDLRTNHPALIIDAAIERVRGGDRYPLEGSPIADFVAAGYCEVDVIDEIRLLEPC